MNEDNEPRAASGLRRLAEGVRRALVRPGPSTNAAVAVEEYVRVIPVLAGQVREASSEIEHSRLTLRQLLECAHDVERLALGLRILAFNAKSESAHPDERGAGVAAVVDEISQHADLAAAAAEEIRGIVSTLDVTRPVEDPGVNQRLQTVVDTLSEMQSDFVAALQHPQEPSAFSGEAAVRLRQRYILTSSRT